jgi:hypothetical protein
MRRHHEDSLISQTKFDLIVSAFDFLLGKFLEVLIWRSHVYSFCPYIPLISFLSPMRLCQNSRNERKSAEGNGRADEKALDLPARSRFGEGRAEPPGV